MDKTGGSAAQKRVLHSVPRRLASMLAQIRATHKGGPWRQQEFATELIKHVRRDPETNEPSVKLSRDVVVNLENRRSPITFAHIESYAKLCNLRTGWLLLISQHSEDTDAFLGLSRLRRQLQLFITVCDRAQQSGRSLNVGDAWYLGELFKERGYIVEAPETDTETTVLDDKPFSFKGLADALDDRSASKDEIKKAIRILVERL